MVHGKNRIPYWIDRRLSGLAGPEYHAIISIGLPIEPEDSQYGESWLDLLRRALRGSAAGCRRPRHTRLDPLVGVCERLLCNRPLDLYRGQFVRGDGQLETAPQVFKPALRGLNVGIGLESGCQLRFRCCRTPLAVEGREALSFALRGVYGLGQFQEGWHGFGLGGLSDESAP